MVGMVQIEKLLVDFVECSCSPRPKNLVISSGYEDENGKKMSLMQITGAERAKKQLLCVAFVLRDVIIA